MTFATAAFSRRRLVLALLALAAVAIAVPLVLREVTPTPPGAGSLVPPPGAALAWSPADAWAVTVLGGVAGAFVALSLHLRRRRHHQADQVPQHCGLVGEHVGEHVGHHRASHARTCG